MKLLFVISPNYLNAIKEESDRYTFYIQGYQNLKLANEGLIKRNIGDILGFLYFGDRLPKKLDALITFIRKVDLIAPKGMIFLIASQSGGNFGYIKNSLKLNNLVIKITYGWEAVTDQTLRSCFSPFLLYNYNPYNNYRNTRGLQEFVYTREGDPINLKYERLFDSKLLEVISPVNVLNTLDSTLTTDKVLYKLSLRRDIYYDIRSNFIKAHFGDSSVISRLYLNLNKVCPNRIIAESICRRVEEIVYEYSKT